MEKDMEQTPEETEAGRRTLSGSRSGNRFQSRNE